MYPSTGQLLDEDPEVEVEVEEIDPVVARLPVVAGCMLPVVASWTLPDVEEEEDEDEDEEEDEEEDDEVDVEEGLTQ